MGLLWGTSRFYNKLSENATKTPVRRLNAYVKNIIKKVYYTIDTNILMIAPRGLLSLFASRLAVTEVISKSSV